VELGSWLKYGEALDISAAVNASSKAGNCCIWSATKVSQTTFQCRDWSEAAHSKKCSVLYQSEEREMIKPR
jgi:hypothetical protein